MLQKNAKDRADINELREMLCTFNYSGTRCGICHTLLPLENNFYFSETIMCTHCFNRERNLKKCNICSKSKTVKEVEVKNNKYYCIQCLQKGQLFKDETL